MVHSILGKRIVWAIDAFEANIIAHQEAARVLESIARKTQGVINPVYVLNADQLNLSEEVTGAWIQQYRPAAEKALKKILSEVNLGVVVDEPHVILQRTTSSVEATDLLSAYAASIDAGAIFVTTHGRKGVKRLLLGSFAETLLLRSTIPVLVLGPAGHKQLSLDHIIFPSEFGSHSQNVFRNVVQLAKELSARMTLFHSVPHPIEPIFQSGVYLLGGSWIPIHSYFGEEIDRQNRHGEAWTRWASHQGVETDFVLDTQGGSIATALSTLALQKNAGLIAIEEQSGPISAALLGSITRQVIRNAPCPVWVVRYNQAEEKGKPEPGQKVA